jgi:glycosyltransferase involved in cell wall biosynthesis
MSARPVRVVRVIARLNIGGPALHATLLTDGLDPARFETFLVAGKEEPAEGNYLALHGRACERLRVLPSLSREIRGLPDLLALGALTRLFRSLRPDVVHTHTAKAGTVGRLAARLAGVPVVVHTYHGHVFHGYFSPAKTRVFLAIERGLARRTDHLLTVSDTVRHELLDLGVGRPEQLTVMPLGLDLRPFRQARPGALRAELGVGPAVPLVGIVARLVAIKAHEVFLAAAAAVARQMPSSLFVVVGDGDRRGELEGLARQLGVAERTRFLGWRRDLDRIYADLDVVALCSRNEGSPVSLIEAMAAARPVVATRVGGVADLVEDGVAGCLVPPGDADALAAAIAALLGDRERAQAMGEAGRKRVDPAFGAERLVADVERLYTDLVERARR